MRTKVLQFQKTHKCAFLRLIRPYRVRQVAANQRSIVPGATPGPSVFSGPFPGDPERPKSLQKKKTLSRSNSSLDEELRPALASRRDYGSTSSIDLLAAKGDAGLEAAGPVGGSPGGSHGPQGASGGGSGSAKGRSVHFKAGSGKESSSSSSLAFLKRLRHSGKSSSHSVSSPGRLVRSKPSYEIRTDIILTFVSSFCHEHFI